MDHDHQVSKHFQEALHALALPAHAQVQVTEPGDVPTELIEDYWLWSRLYLETGPTALSWDACRAIHQLATMLHALPEDVYAETNFAAMCHPAWEPIREHATALLALLGWPRTPLQPYREGEPGVWRRG
jgi:hypothetical protein